MGTPSGFIAYPYRFEVEGSFLNWRVVVHDTINKTKHPASGPFLSRRTASRACQSLTQFYRTGWDMGKRGICWVGGGRFA